VTETHLFSNVTGLCARWGCSGLVGFDLKKRFIAHYAEKLLAALTLWVNSKRYWIVDQTFRCVGGITRLVHIELIERHIVISINLKGSDKFAGKVSAFWAGLWNRSDLGWL